MKLFNPTDASKFVFAVCPKGYREGTAPNYAAVSGASVEDALKSLDMQKLVSVYPHAVGRYDEQGRYQSYCPPIEHVKAGRFVEHPMAAQAEAEQVKSNFEAKYAWN